MRGLAEEHFGRLHDRFGQGRMRMNRQLEVGRVRAHLDREHAFRDQFARAGADETDAEETLGLGIENQLGQAVGAIERDGAARRAPGKLRDRRPSGSPSPPAPRSDPPTPARDR